ncbi:hypothetical protein [Vitiosangium sp. GDMCC 1.1324]|uniref:hypothetical protein n=1 Tax=Vitiosangium sp. (strain GDMCC 1.1324) TaxID=2138576 RepID=UPI000D350B6B|nr:hypothetical protein [Vitiosangium sp. GDMCC 1.1324]PTL76601.1 hypothetical protein DAT35_49220 [Vitiosangium sp. GDMCC 1.1324]
MGDNRDGSGETPKLFRIVQRYRGIRPGLGRLYEARNKTTGNAVLVLTPGSKPNWRPRSSWQVRATSQVEPPLVILEVEQAPISGKLPELAEVLDLVTCAVERVEERADANQHLTSGPEVTDSRHSASRPHPAPRLHTASRRHSASRRHWPRAGAIAAAALALGAVALWLRPPESSETKPGVAGSTRQEEVTFVNGQNGELDLIAYSLPDKPFKGQKTPPCLKGREVEIHGGCWVQLKQDAPCSQGTAEHEGKCYMPVGANPPEPRALQP